MSNSLKLPDVMPDIVPATLLVVCDSHHCRLIDVGGHTMLEHGSVDSGELKHADRQSTKVGPSGGVGIGDDHHAEDQRLTNFSKTILERVGTLIASQKIEALYLAAPSRLLSVLKKQMPEATKKVLKSAIDGTFVKESSIDVLMRFRPDLESSVQKLRDMENYSSKKHLPK